MPNITFVDKNDKLIGYGTIAEAQSKGIVHRVAQIFVFNSKGDLLIQKRSPYIDLPNRWDQSAAGYVDEDEDYVTAATRELREEIDVSGVNLTKIAKYYSDETFNNVTKKRFNMLYRVSYDGSITFEPKEVSEVRWIGLQELESWMKQQPQDFTKGFLNSYKQYRLHN